MTDRLSPLDASFLEIEEQDEASHMHIGWAMVFEPLPEGGAPTVDRVRAQLEPRLGALPRFGARLSAPRPRVVAAAGAAVTLPVSIARAGADVVTHPRLAGRLTRAVAELIVRDELIGAPHTSLNVPIAELGALVHTPGAHPPPAVRRSR